MSIALPKIGFRKVAAASAVAVATAGLSVLVVAPAAQAQSADLNYTCGVPLLGDKTFIVSSDTNSPATVPAGKSFVPRVTATVTIPADVASVITGTLKATTAEGSAQVSTLVNGATKTVSMTIPKTTIPSGALPVAASGNGAAIKAGNAGTTIKMAASSFTSHLVLKKADGSPADLMSEIDVACTLQPDQDASVDTVKVVKAASTTRATVAYSKARKRAIATATVKGAYGNRATGSVRFVLKKAPRSSSASPPRSTVAEWRAAPSPGSRPAAPTRSSRPTSATATSRVRRRS